MSKYYFVISTPYQYIDAVCDDGTGPSYDERDVWEGFAVNKTHVKSLALKEWDKNDSKSIDLNRGDHKHPMSGCKVLEFNEE